MCRAILAALLMLFSTPSHATQCAERSFEAQEKAAAVIFEGEVIGLEGMTGDGHAGACWQSSKDGSGCGAKIATFKISKVWKGDATRISTVATEDACLCVGQGFEKGKRYLVFANPDSEHAGADYQATDACGGTSEIKKGSPEPAGGALGKIFKPRSPLGKGNPIKRRKAGRSN